MKDFLKRYQKRKMIWKIYMVLWAFVMAFAINFLVIDGSNFEKNLTASVLDSGKNIESKADFYFSKEENKLFLKNSKNMKNVENISFSLVYDPSSLQIDDVLTDFWKVESLSEKYTWSETFILYIDKKDFEIWKNIAEIKFSKKDEKIWTQINLLNSNFTDSEKNTYSLTTSWITL